jgi:hypothetical protein
VRQEVSEAVHDGSEAVWHEYSIQAYGAFLVKARSIDEGWSMVESYIDQRPKLGFDYNTLFRFARPMNGSTPVGIDSIPRSEDIILTADYTYLPPQPITPMPERRLGHTITHIASEVQLALLSAQDDVTVFTS